MDKYTDMDVKISIITNKSTENILSYPELINQCAHTAIFTINIHKQLDITSSPIQVY